MAMAWQMAIWIFMSRQGRLAFSGNGSSGLSSFAATGNVAGRTCDSTSRANVLASMLASAPIIGRKGLPRKRECTTTAISESDQFGVEVRAYLALFFDWLGEVPGQSPFSDEGSQWHFCLQATAIGSGCGLGSDGAALVVDFAQGCERMCRQLVSAGQGRDRLSHSARSSWAAVHTGCAPRCK